MFRPTGGTHHTAVKMKSQSLPIRAAGQKLITQNPPTHTPQQAPFRLKDLPTELFLNIIENGPLLLGTSYNPPPLLLALGAEPELYKEACRLFYHATYITNLSPTGCKGL